MSRLRMLLLVLRGQRARFRALNLLFLLFLPTSGVCRLFGGVRADFSPFFVVRSARSSSGLRGRGAASVEAGWEEGATAVSAFSVVSSGAFVSTSTATLPPSLTERFETLRSSCRPTLVSLAVLLRGLR